MPLSKLQELKGHHVLEVKVVRDAQSGRSSSSSYSSAEIADGRLALGQ